MGYHSRGGLKETIVHSWVGTTLTYTYATYQGAVRHLQKWAGWKGNAPCEPLAQTAALFSGAAGVEEGRREEVGGEVGRGDDIGECVSVCICTY